MAEFSLKIPKNKKSKLDFVVDKCQNVELIVLYLRMQRVASSNLGADPFRTGGIYLVEKFERDVSNSLYYHTTRRDQFDISNWDKPVNSKIYTIDIQYRVSLTRKTSVR